MNRMRFTTSPCKKADDLLTRADDIPGRIQENRTNKGWADYVMENHYSILNNFTDADLPEACYILAHTLNYQIKGKEITDDDYHTNQVISTSAVWESTRIRRGKTTKKSWSTI